MTDTKQKNTPRIKMGIIADRPYWILVFSIFIRAVHQIGAAVFLCSYLFPEKLPLPRLYFLIAGISGIVLVVTEWLRHRQLLREFSGISTIVKLILLGLAYHMIFSPKLLVAIAFFLASVCSHAPKSVRHRLLF